MIQSIFDDYKISQNIQKINEKMQPVPKKGVNKTFRQILKVKRRETMKFISWNIDSLNAALTADSSRAILSREVLNTIIKCDPEIIALQETKLSSNGPTKKH